MANEFWPALHPPLLNRLPTTATTQTREVIPSTLEIEIEQLDRDEDRFSNQMHEIRSFGYAWLIPLGRLNTQEEDQESSFTSSPAAPRLHSPELGDIPPTPPFVQPQHAGDQAARDQEMEGEQEEDLDAAIEDADDSFGEGSEEEEEEESEDGEEARFVGSGATMVDGQGDEEDSEQSSSPESVDV